MKAAFVRAPFTFEVRDIDQPTPGHGEVLLDVDRVGLCGTDIHLAKAWATEWRRFGHETAARVASLGAGVDDLAEGDLVTVRTTTMCGTCRSCMDGRPAYCLDWRRSRMSVAIAEQMVAPRRSIWPVTDLDPVATTLIEPLSVAINLVDTAEVGLGHDVAVVGPGPIGMMAIKLARLRGARRIYVLGAEADVARFPLCRDLGADVCFPDPGVDPLARILDETDGLGLDRVLVTAPPVAIPAALRLGGWGAIVTFVGFGAHNDDAVVPIDLNAVHYAKLQLRASYAAPLAPFAQANRMLAEGALPVTRLVTHSFPLAEVAEAVDVVASHRDGVVKAVVCAQG